MVSAKPYKGFRWEAVGEFFLGTVFLCALLFAAAESSSSKHLVITKLIAIAVLFGFLLYVRREAILSWLKGIASFSEDTYEDYEVYKISREDTSVITLRTLEFSGSQICLPGVTRTYAYTPDKKDKPSSKQKQKSSSKKRRVGEQLSLFSA